MTPEDRLRKQATTPPTRGKVLNRETDRRLRPHTPEHRAAIRAGQARSNWSRDQRELALQNKPHDLVPIRDQRTADALTRRWAAERDDRAAMVGKCHWCYVCGVNPGHTS